MWHVGGFPNKNAPVYILVEESACRDNVPFLAKAILVKTDPTWCWKLLEFDPEEEEEILQQHYSVVAWRYVN